MLEKTLESSLDCKIKPVNPKGNQPWVFIGRTGAEVLVLWPANTKSWLIGKDPDSGKDWGQEEKGETEGEMVGWHQRLSGHEFEQAQWENEGQESLACCSSWRHKELDVTWWLNNSNKTMWPRSPMMLANKTHLGLITECKRSVSLIIFLLLDP